MLWLIALCFSANITVSAQEVIAQDSLMCEATFRFVPGKDMLFSPWGGNGESLLKLSRFININRDVILSGKAPVLVFGYCASAGTPEVCLHRALLMSNRVKSEMILRNGLREEDFRTRNSTQAYGKLRNAVVVRIVLPQTVSAVEDIPVEQPVIPVDTILATKNTSLTDTALRADAEVPVKVIQTAALSRWSVGVNVGIPFFWGDMVSMSADKTYIGIGAGIQGSYRFSKFFGLELSADYAQGKMGACDYARNYQLTPGGMTLYSAGTDTSLSYDELYSKISVVNVGLGLNLYLNRLFGIQAVHNRFQVVLTPAVYGQFFTTEIFRKTDDGKFSDDTTKPGAISLGLGGALSLRYRIASAWDLQLKNSVLWITDNKFDGIVIPYDHTRHNALWLPQVGMLWHL